MGKIWTCFLHNRSRHTVHPPIRITSKHIELTSDMATSTRISASEGWGLPGGSGSGNEGFNSGAVAKGLEEGGTSDMITGGGIRGCGGGGGSAGGGGAGGKTDVTEAVTVFALSERVDATAVAMREDELASESVWLATTAEGELRRTT